MRAWHAAWVVALGWAAVAGAQDLKKVDDADWRSIATEGEATLVPRPAPLAGLARWTLESPRHRGRIAAMSVSPDGTRVATGGSDGVLRIWNLETGEIDRAFMAHRYGIGLVAWSPDGALVATHAGCDGTTRVWEVESGRERAKVTRWGGIVRLAWSPDSRSLAAGTSGSGKVYVSKAFAEPTPIKEMGAAVQAITWSPSGDRIAVAAAASSVVIVDPDKPQAARTLDGEGNAVGPGLAWSPDGATLAVGSAGGVTVWESANARPRPRLAAPASDVAWSPDGASLLVRAGGTVQVFPADGADPAKPRHRFTVPATALVAWNRGSGKVVVVSPDRIDVVEPDGTKVTSIDAGGAEAPVFAPGRPLVTGVGTPVLTTWDPRSFARTAALEGHAKPVTVAAWSPDGRSLASGDEGGEIRVWPVGREGEPAAWQAHKGAVRVLAWSPDGKRLASIIAGDKAPRLWTEAGEAAGALEGHERSVLSLAWSPNGRLLAIGDADEKAGIWATDPVSRERMVEFTEPVWALAWSPAKGGSTVAAILGDAVIQFFDPKTGRMLGGFADRRAQGIVSDAALAWMPGAGSMLLVGRNSLVQAWDLAAGKPVMRQMAVGGVADVAAVAGGAVVAVRARDRTVRFHAANAAQWTGALVDAAGVPVAVGPTGDVKHPADVEPELIAIVAAPDGRQAILPLGEFAKRHGWKATGKSVKLPAKP